MLDFLAHGRVEAVDVDNDVVLIQLVEIAWITGKGKALAGLNVAVQADRALAAGGYRVDSELRAGVAVAADEDILLCGLESYGICHCNALCGGLERADIQLAPVDGLADSADDGIDLDGLELAGTDGLSSALLVRLAKLHDLDLQAVDLAGCGAGDLNGSVEVAELHALCHCFGDLFLICRHLVLAAAIDYVSLLGAEADSRAHNVHCDVAAADNGDLLADLDLIAEVDVAQEINAAVNALEVFTGYAELCRILRADGDEEALIALLAQLVDGDILADLDAALELDAHFLKHVDLGVYDLALEAEGRDTEGEHASGDRVAVENGDICVTHLGQVISTAHAGRACADHCDLLDIIGVGSLMAALFGDVTGLFAQLLLGDELLDLVDGNRTVKLAAGACVLAVLAADAAADCREGVILLDELESIGVAAVGCHLDVALNRDVSRACDLAGCGAGGPGLDRAVFVFVIFVPVILAPLGLVGKLVMRILDGAFLGAELLAEADGAGRAGLNTLAAGDALLGVGLCGVC